MHRQIAIGLIAGSLCVQAWAQTDLNQATEIELDGLNGLGPAVTRQILNERLKAPFKDWKDAMRRIKGIGPAKASSLSAQGLHIQGSPYPTQPQTPSSTTPP